MTELSNEQKSVVNHDLAPLCVTACAGSGKTRTAVHRLAEMRHRLNDRHGIVALLSFSNVAVDTFRKDYHSLALEKGQSYRVEIDTMDAFITRNILRPHAYRTMRASRSAYLVAGSEPFLKGFTVFDGKRPHPTASLRVRLKSGKFAFEVGENYAPATINASSAIAAISKLGVVGAYSHELGRYWACQTLKEQPFLLRALSRRYPHILVDEAQDIGPEHQAILEMMVSAGTQLSLIGDPNQGIYDFVGADGFFLRDYSAREGVAPKRLTRNYRSVPAVLKVANKLSGREDDPDRDTPEHLNGAFYIPYQKTDKPALLCAFRSMIESAKLEAMNAAIVCRASKWAEEWGGKEAVPGQGTVKAFARATLYRDKLRRYDDAFRLTVYAIVNLLADNHGDMAQKILRRAQYPEHRLLRRIIWGFARDPVAGLPSGSLLAETQWHPALVARVKALLGKLEQDLDLSQAKNIGNKLKKTGLVNKVLIQQPDFVMPERLPIRTCTVHQAKGESIDAVMYIADKSHVRALLGGTESETGRIGYVAVTRARNLFVLAVPENCEADLESELIRYGFLKAGS